MAKELTTPTMLNILDQLKEGVIVVEGDGTIQYLNQSALILLELDQRPATLYEVVAAYEAWQELLLKDGLSYLYTTEAAVKRLRSKLPDCHIAWELESASRRGI